MNDMEIIHIDSSDDEEDDARTKTAPAKGGGCIASSLDPTPTPSKQLLAKGLSGMDVEDDDAAALSRNNTTQQPRGTTQQSGDDDDDSSASSSDSILEESLSSKPKAKTDPSAKSKGEPTLGKRAPIALDGTSEDELEIAGVDNNDDGCKMGGVDVLLLQIPTLKRSEKLTRHLRERE